MKLDPCVSACTKVCSKWIKHLSIRPETAKNKQKEKPDTSTYWCKDFLNRNLYSSENRIPSPLKLRMKHGGKPNEFNWDCLFDFSSESLPCEKYNITWRCDVNNYSQQC